MSRSNAKLPDPALYIQAGINPKTGAPLRVDAAAEGAKADFKLAFRIIDEQDAVNRYKWFNLPCDLTSEELERLIYYKGQLCFFYMKETNEFFFMPYALDGSIDFYGRFNTIHPVPMASGTTEPEKAQFKAQASLLSRRKLKVIKAPKELEDLTLEDFEDSTVLLYDYTKQLSQTIIPRQQINEAFLDTAAEIVPYMQTALLASCGVKGMRVNDGDAADEARRASEQVRFSALTKKIYNAITAPVEFQELAEGSTMKVEEYLLALQGIDNLRKSALGIENGGIFQKKAHKLESEQVGNESSVQTVFQDGLSVRQHFCIIANSIWGTNMWVMPSEAVLGQDINMDGQSYDIDEGNSSGTSDNMSDPEGGNEQ